MFRFQEIPPDGDPSSRIQEFQEVLPRLLCCRYWWMADWKSQQDVFSILEVILEQIRQGQGCVQKNDNPRILTNLS